MLQSTRARLENLALTLKLIEAQHKDHPDYCQDVASGIVDAELAILARESSGESELERETR